MEGACLPAYGPGGGAPRAWRPSTHACVCACLCTQVVEEEGVAALFKGAAERVMRSSPQFGAACVCVHAHVFMPWRTRSYEVLSIKQVSRCALSAR